MSKDGFVACFLVFEHRDVGWTNLPLTMIPPLLRVSAFLNFLFNKIQVESLETRVEALEKGAIFDATQAAIRKREEEMLTTLRNIQEQMAKEAATTGGGSASSANATELKEIKAENERLKATIIKQEYRIRHLITGMEELLAAKKG